MIQEKSFQPKKLLLIFFGLFLLLFSWFHHLTHPIWESLDLAFFRFVNGFIATNSFWQNFWAICNHNLTDWFHDIVMLTFFLLYIFRKDEKPKSRKIAEVFYFAVLVTFTILFINRYLCLDFFHIKRKSPTLLFDFATLLSKEVHWLKIKDHSFVTYPGDHGTTALLFAFFTYHLMGKRAGFIAFMYNFVWQMPRLVTGCHWLTDIVMGSLVISSFMVSISIYTPLKESFVSLLSRLFKKEKKSKAFDLKPQ